MPRHVLDQLSFTQYRATCQKARSRKFSGSHHGLMTQSAQLKPSSYGKEQINGLFWSSSSTSVEGAETCSLEKPGGNPKTQDSGSSSFVHKKRAKICDGPHLCTSLFDSCSTALNSLDRGTCLRKRLLRKYEDKL